MQAPADQMLGRLVVQDVYSGPLPEPRTLKEYDIVMPGAAQIIIEMAQREQEHRHRLEDGINASMIRDTDAEITGRTRAQWMAFAFAIVSVCLGAWLISLDHTIAGSIFAGSCIVGIVSSFLKSGRKKPEPSVTPPAKRNGQ